METKYEVINKNEIIAAALAALTQRKTYQADIDYAVSLLNSILETENRQV